LRTTDSQANVASLGRSVAAVLWDFEQPDQKVSNHSVYTKLIPNRATAPVELEFTHLEPNAAYRLRVYRTGYDAKDAHSAYIGMGSPRQLLAEPVAHLNEETRDLPESDNSLHSKS